VRVLTWNLYHGRAVPPAGRPLLAEFSAALAGWEWDVALLQECPPWWPPELARAAGAQQRTRLTSRNQLLFLRRFLAERWPDLMKSSGGGCDAILVRGDRPILAHVWQRLRLCPEQRYVHGVQLEDGWVVNVHAHNHPLEKALADDFKALDAAKRWAGGAPLIFGGDLNLHQAELPAFPGMLHVAGNHVDHIYTSGRAAAGRQTVIDRGMLSDHPPVAITLA
jgi:endonuclease/exonuclease/phosphatase family metal-dependent hydrolase